MNGKPEKSFFTRLRDRKVIRVAAVYILVGWVVLQVGEVTFEALLLPGWSLSLLIALVVLGFPIALVLAWAYELTPKGIRRDPEDVEKAETREESSTSIAVLPFEDMSEHGDQGYFCEGIAEEILNALCKIPDLRVASRVTTFQFCRRHEGAGVEEIGEKLHVGNVLEGSVRKAGDRLRITAQLVKTADGYHLWSRQYDRGLADIFSIQEEIAQSIAETLSVTLHASGLGKQQVTPKAYDFFLRGLSYFAHQNIEDTIYARQMFERAIEVEPGFGRAWAGLAYTFGFEHMYFNASNVNRDEALRTSEKALELAPEWPESHIAAGIAHCMVQDYQAATEEFQRALELNPESYEAHYFFGRSKVHEGDLESARSLFERAAEILPEDYQSMLLLPQIYHSLDDREREMEAARKGIARARAVLELNPDDNRALNMGAFALMRLGDKDEAVKWMEESVRKAPMDSIVHYNAACLYALAGDAEKSIDCLENCRFKVGNLNREWLLHDSDLDSVRSHPRFTEILNSFAD